MGQEASGPRAPRPRRQSGPDHLEPSLAAGALVRTAAFAPVEMTVVSSVTCRQRAKGSLTHAGLITLSLSSKTRESPSVSCGVKAKVPTRAGVCSGRVPPRPPGPGVTVCQRPRPSLLPDSLRIQCYFIPRSGGQHRG